MHNLIQQGKILYWGTSEWSAQEIMEAHMFARQNHLIGPTMEQPQYNMLVRQKFEVEYDQVYKTVGLGTTIWSPLASGLLTGKYNGKGSQGRLSIEKLTWLKERNISEENLKTVGRLKVIADDLGVSLAQLAIAWTLKNPHVSTAILGASKVDQLHENLKSMEVQEKLSEDVMERISVALNNEPVFPAF